MTTPKDIHPIVMKVLDELSEKYFIHKRPTIKKSDNLELGRRHARTDENSPHRRRHRGTALPSAARRRCNAVVAPARTPVTQLVTAGAGRTGRYLQHELVRQRVGQRRHWVLINATNHSV